MQTATRRIGLSLAAGAIGLAATAGFASVNSHSSATPPMSTLGKFSGVKTHYTRSGGSTTNNLTFHGGSVEITPTVYIDYWGSWWNGGTTTGTQNSNSYGPTTTMTYNSALFTQVGGTSWSNINSQYCQGVASGTINCGTSGTHITNPAGQLASTSTWIDTSTSPGSSPTQGQIAAEAVVAAKHFGLTGAQAATTTIFVYTGSKQSMSGFAAAGTNGTWCAWHSTTSYAPATGSSTTLPYAYMPYMPDAGGSCGMNFINSSSSANSFGNGYFDGFSIVGGHEYAEAVTDPFLSNWYDSGGSETGDKCAWSSSSKNQKFATNTFAMQPLWSNATSGCVNSY